MQRVRITFTHLYVWFCVYAFARIHTNLYTFVLNRPYFWVKSNVHIRVRFFFRCPFVRSEVKGTHKYVRLRNFWHSQKNLAYAGYATYTLYQALSYVALSTIVYDIFTAGKVSVFGVILVRIFPCSNWIRRDTE